MFSFEDLMREAIGGGIVAPLVSLIVLPLIYRIVGVSKRERAQRDALELRTALDLVRGMDELARADPDPDARAAYARMHGQALTDFRRLAAQHFEEERRVAENPGRRYWLLPAPRGFFGFIWSAIAVLFALLNLLFFVTFVSQLGEEAEKVQNMAIGFVFLLVVFGALMMLFRYFAFLSARFGLSGRAQSQRQAAY